MTRAELYQEFKNRPYSVAITKAMWFIQENSTIECTEEDLQKMFDKYMDILFTDTTLTTGYEAEIAAGEFSYAALERFDVYARNCLREDLGSTMEA